MTRRRIGIAGWAVRTGLGYMNYDMWHLGFADTWLAVEHPKVGFDSQVLPPEALQATSSASSAVYRDFLDAIDILVFCERPVTYQFPLVQEAKRRGILTCCIPMMEWLPPISSAAPWLNLVDVMWAPTLWSGQELRKRAEQAQRKKLRIPWLTQIHGGRWGVNLSRFPFCVRHKCNEFLFCNGFGGAYARKGLEALRAACWRVPDVPVLLRSQRDGCDNLPRAVELLVDNAEQPYEIYQRGDVLLAPSRFEGLGLQLYEAQACGLPVITTAGAPMDECRPMDFIPARKGMATLNKWSVVTYEADVLRLAELMRQYHGIALTDISMAARRNVEENFSLADTLGQLREVLESRFTPRPLAPPRKLSKNSRPTIEEARRRRRPR